MRRRLNLQRWFELGRGELTRGFCFKCGREIGGLFKPPAWMCSTCHHLYCERCAKDRVGFLFKKPACPQCRIELRGG